LGALIWDGGGSEGSGKQPSVLVRVAETPHWSAIAGGVEQAVVEAVAMADDLAAVHHRHDDALHPARQRLVKRPRAAFLERLVLSAREARRVGALAQPVGGLRRHPHASRRRRHAAMLGKR